MKARIKSQDRQDSHKDTPECPRCGFSMAHLQACHLRCNNCGAELTCSDKGGYW